MIGPLTLLIFMLSSSCVYADYQRAPRLSRARYSCPPIKLENGQTRLVANNRMITFRCNNGLRLVGPISASCNRRKWDKQPPICVATGCPDVTTSLTPGLDVTGLRYDGAMVEFGCDENLRLFGSAAIYCNGNEWNDTVPMCFGVPSLETTFQECTFDADTCGWTDDVTDAFNWNRNSGATATRNTGPSVDHTTGDTNGYYMFIETSTPRKDGDIARLVSPEYSPEWSESCLDLWYHMFGAVGGSDNVGSLRVYARPPGVSVSTLTPLFNLRGNQQDMWHPAQVKIPRLAHSFQIVIEAERGISFYSDIAIDDLTLWDCSRLTTTVVPSELPTTVEPTEKKTSVEPTQRMTSSPTTQSVSPSAGKVTTTEPTQPTQEPTQESTTASKKPPKHKPPVPKISPAKGATKLGNTGASTEDESGNGRLPVILGVTFGVLGTLVLIAVAVYAVKRRNKRGRTASKSNDNTYMTTIVTPHPNTNGQSGNNVSNTLYMSLA